MRRVAVVLALVVAACLTTGAPAYAAQEGPRRDHVTRSADGVYVIGDSLTYRGRSQLLDLQPGWSVNGVNGRPVSAMPRLVRNILRTDRDPAAVVVALGSNPSRGWSAASLRRTVALLPAETYVVLVTTYKSSRWPRHGVRMTTRYNRWMAQLAAVRPQTCTAPWSEAAAAHREWLVDGLHATARGYVERAQLISDTLFDCE